jgi:hypothetical protein
LRRRPRVSRSMKGISLDCMWVWNDNTTHHVH